MLLLDFIRAEFCGIQARFAVAQDVARPQVTQWIKRGFVVADWALYSPRRTLVNGGAGVFALPDYIDSHYDGVQASFAAAEGVARPQVTQWIKRGYVVIDGALCLPRRPLNKMASAC
jgi:DNA-binding transcriptional regulator YdaS (Cro superfamily)